ncbi:MAG: lipid-A-disaccharide synthase [Candidatus Margulisiibacteriota bacterium]
MASLLLIAGELSGDRYGAALAVRLKTLDPTLHLTASGGPQLQAVADVFLDNIAHESAVGLKEQLWKRSVYTRFYDRLKTHLQTHKPDQAVIVDFPHHNEAIAAILKAAGIPIVTYITPHFWIWKDLKKAKKLVGYSDTIITIFEPEYRFYKTHFPTADVRYFGHPLVAMVQPSPSEWKGRQLTLFPGSRQQELDLLLKPMLSTAKAFLNRHPDVNCTLAVSDPAFEVTLSKAIEAMGLPISLYRESDKAPLLSRSDWVLCASGSTTLEVLLYRKPMVILGALPPLTYFVAKYLLRIHIPWVSLPNIVAGHQAIPEFVQRFNPQKIADTLGSFSEMTARTRYLQTADSLVVQLSPTSDPILEAAKSLLNKK